jgi:hypothetical protein
MLTAPLIVLDLMLQLRAPYSISSTLLIYAELLISLMTQFYGQYSSASYMWFTFSYGLKLFGNSFQYILIRRQYEHLQKLAIFIGAKTPSLTSTQ